MQPIARKYVQDICVVAATKGGETQLWAVALPHEQAVEAVASEVGPDWQVAVTDRRLTVEKAAALDMPRQRIKCMGTGGGG